MLQSNYMPIKKKNNKTESWAALNSSPSENRSPHTALQLVACLGGAQGPLPAQG